MKKISSASRGGFINYGIVIVFFAVFQTLIATKHLSNNFKGQLIPICAYVIMALSLNLVVGISGELSLGHAGFMSVGAFTGVIVATSLQNSVTAGPVRLILAILIGALFAAIAGVLIGIPVLRLQGDYLAIVTLAFGEIIKNIINCLYVGVDANGLHFSMTDATALGMDADGTVILNGPMGATGVTKLSTFVSGIILVIIVLFIVQNLVNSRAGRAIKAIRDNRIAAEATGLNVNLFLSHEHGGIEQIGQRIIYNEIDMVLFFNSPQDNTMDDDVMYICRLCDQHSVPMATNVATAELLIHGLARGDLDWREVMNPNRVPFAL